MFSNKWRPLLGAGILLASGLQLACDSDLQDSLMNPGNGSFFTPGTNDPGGDPGSDPRGGGSSSDPTSTTNNGGSTSTDPGANPGGSNSSGSSGGEQTGGEQTGGGTLNIVPVDTRPVTMVTNLEDTYYHEPLVTGSLRWAVANAPTPGIIRFSVGGAIKLKGSLPVRRSDLEIDGSTAPAGGITIQREQFEIRDTHDVVIKNLRFRSGDGFADEAERVSMHGQYKDLFASDYSGGIRSLAILGSDGPCRKIRIENCSIQNSTDDNATIWGDCAEVTFYRCLISGGYSQATKGMLGGTNTGSAVATQPVWITVQQCLFINQWGRMPDLQGNTVNLVNNVVVRPMQGGRLTYPKANIVGNCLFSMPNHPWYVNADRVFVTTLGTTTPGCLYLNGNLLDGNFEAMTKIVGIVNGGQTPLPAGTFRNEPFPGLPANVLSAPQALVAVLSNAGCSGPGRDGVDLTQIDQAAAAVGIDPATVR